jgi:hypothetical protein
LEKREFALGVSAPLRKAGFGRNEANGSSFGSGTKQGSLRTAQYFYAVKIEKDRKSIARRYPLANEANLNWCVIEVNAGCCRSHVPDDSANGDNGLPAKAYGRIHAGGKPRDVLNVADG